ncbi:SDR family oxidoreductase [Streptomyces sp. NPDC058301]|uniref:SDR family oxidoreductase n=1 Tax=Streptomyces sp. NPDC058301 TaxID=3346436 RepID=UPI0036EB9A44
MTDDTSPLDTPLPGLPAPPPPGARALPPGTYDGTVVLVTGGGSGLGKAMAAEFARLGADLVIVGRGEERLEAARQELAGLGGRVVVAGCDVRDPEQVGAAFDLAVREAGLPGVLVNSAAANFPCPAEDLSPNAWRAVVDVTLTGTWFTTREFGRRHLAAGTPGSVINVGASYAWTGGPAYAPSAAAKAGVRNLVETLAVEWGPYGIQVNGLVPGLFPHPDMPDAIRSGLETAAGRGELDTRQPALRVGEPRELGWAATFLASPYARFISGHTLVVDGANWQRRTVVAAPVTPVREQLGRGPFGG